MVFFCVTLQLLNTPLEWQEKRTLSSFEATICGDVQETPNQLQLTPSGPSPGSAMVRRRQVDKRGRVTEVGSKVGQQRLCLALSVWRCGLPLLIPSWQQCFPVSPGENGVSGCLLDGWGEALLAAVSGGVLLVPVNLKGGMIQLTHADGSPRFQLVHYSHFVAELSLKILICLLPRSW